MIIQFNILNKQSYSDSQAEGIMKSYEYEQNQQQEIQQYKQELGLRKMLYKYQHENEQLRNQIKALTERLESILSFKKSVSPQPVSQSAKNHEKYLQQQLNYYFKRIEQLNGQIKKYKQQIDQSKQQEYTRLLNLVNNKTNKLETLKSRLQKFVSDDNKVKESQVKMAAQSNISMEQLENKYSAQLEDLKKRVRELEKTRDNNMKSDINRHAAMVTLQVKARRSNQILPEPESSDLVLPKKKGVWGMDFTEENYKKISNQLQQLKKQKAILLSSIQMENFGLRQQLARLKNQYIDLSANSNVSQSMNLGDPDPIASIRSSRVKQTKAKQIIVLPQIIVPLGQSAYERKNDKNFVPKSPKLIEWNINKNKKGAHGFSWNDQNCKSPITGINLWFDKHLVGIQFIHTLSQTTQHLHSEGGETKKLVPIQYRLNNNDYLENILLVTTKSVNNSNSQIVGIELAAKSGRRDQFGSKAGVQGTQKFDFSVKNPEKPIYSYGSFTINPSTRLSCINSLGFAVI